MVLKKSLIIFVSLCVIGSLIYIVFNMNDNSEPINDSSVKDISNSNSEVPSFSASNIEEKIGKKSNKNINYNDLSYDEIEKLRVENPSGIIISDLEEADLPEETKKNLREKFNNLKQYGNFNKNQLSHEFKNISKYKKYVNLNKPLSFLPTKNDLLENNFKLTGKYYSGAYSEEGGYDSYTRLYEDPKSMKKVELVETYLNPKNYSTIQRFSESFNKNIDGVNLTWQEIPVGDTTVYSVDFSNNQKDFSLSTIRMEKNDVENLVLSLIRESNNFRNEDLN